MKKLITIGFLCAIPFMTLAQGPYTWWARDDGAAVLPDFPSSNSLVVYAPLNEVSPGVGTNASGDYPNQGTIGGVGDILTVGAPNDPAYTTNDFGGFWSFDGTDRLCISDAAALTFSTGMTLSIWLKDGNADTTHIVSGKDSTAPGGREWAVSITNGFQGKIVLHSQGQANNVQFGGDDMLPTNEWYMLTMTIDMNATNSLVFGWYTNGAAADFTATRTDFGGLGDTATDQYIATRSTFDFLFTGSMDEYALWNKALPASEVADLYTITKDKR